jgi:hypothetical protein
MTVLIIFRHPKCTMDHLGLIPSMLNGEDSRPAREQLDKAYAFGGWQPLKGFKLKPDDSLSYPGDPDQHPIAEFQLPGHDERVLMYNHAWVAIIQPDRSFEVCRMD